MSSVDLKIIGITLATILAYMMVANVIPQVESEVPPDVAFGEEVSPEELVEVGEELYEGAGGCVACHAETPGARAPNLRTDYEGEGTIGARCADRIEGMDCKEYLHESLVLPTDHLVDDYSGIMPPADRTLSDPQIWSLVAYLESLGGEVTVTSDDIPEEADEEEGGEEAGAGEGGGGPEIAATEPEEIIREVCLQCHVLGEEGSDLGPPFDEVAARRSADEIRLAILDPPALVAEEYEDVAGLMPVDFGERLTAGQLEAVVSYLSELQ